MYKIFSYNVCFFVAADIYSQLFHGIFSNARHNDTGIPPLSNESDKIILIIHNSSYYTQLQLSDESLKYVSTQ